MKRKILIILSLVFFMFSTVNAEYSNFSIKRAYNKIVTKLQSKYSINKQYTILKKLDSKIIEVLNNKSLSVKNKNIINYLYTLNLLELDKLKVGNIELNNTDFIAIKEKELDERIKSQQLKEFLIRENLKKEKSDLSIPDYITKLLGSKINLIGINTKNEFSENGDIKRIQFSKYYNIDSSIIDFLSDKSGYIVKRYGESNYWFVEDYNIETKIPYSKFKTSFKGFTSSQVPFFEEKGIYYSYIFTKFNYINDSYGIYKSDLKTNNIDTENLVIFLNDKGVYNLVSDYTKVKLINSNIIEQVSNKWYFLKELADDKKYLYDDTDGAFLSLRNKTLEITSGLTNDEDKIKAIYAWILSNIKYTENIDLKDYRIYSGIKTFDNRDGACEGYSKIMAYMLLFSGFTDLDVIRGYVIDAPDFPQVGHAWVRLGDKYYDPTFDDPIGPLETKKFSDYYYYELPRAVFYKNRYVKDNLPSGLKDKTLSERTQIVNSAIYYYTKGNIDNDYSILKGAKLRIENNFGNRKLTIEDFKKVLDYQVLKDDYRVKVNGNYKTIKNYKYIPVTSENIEIILKNNFNYNTNNLFLFNRQLDGGINDYVLSYDITYHN